MNSQYQIIVNPHEVLGRSRTANQTSSTSKKILFVAVLGCAALACLSATSLNQANAAAGSLSAAKAALSVQAAADATQNVHTHAVQTSQPRLSSQRQGTVKQHLAQIKQTLQEPEAPPTVEAPAPVAPGAPAEEKLKVPIVGDIKDKAESDAVEISQKMGFHLTNEDKCVHKLKNGKCAPKLGEQFELSPLVSFLLIILVIVPAISLVVIWAREPAGLEGLMQVYKYPDHEMVTPK